jgi:hypothetical protein
MNTPTEYIILAVPFHADAATHDELVRKVNQKLNDGYALLGAPFLTVPLVFPPASASPLSKLAG